MTYVLHAASTSAHGSDTQAAGAVFMRHASPQDVSSPNHTMGCLSIDVDAGIAQQSA